MTQTRIPSLVKAEKDLKKFILHSIKVNNKWGDKLDLYSLFAVVVEKMYNNGEISQETYDMINGKNREILQNEGGQ